MANDASPNDPNGGAKPRSKALLFGIPILVVVLVAVGVGVYFLFLKDEKEVAQKENDVDAALECGDATAPETLDGEWTVAADCDSEALLRIEEEFGNGLKDYEAVGSLKDISGSIAIAGTEISTASFTIDLTTIEFIDTGSPVPASGRANAMKDKGLETDTFPDAVFDLTEPIDLGSVPTDGTEVPLDAVGELTLHGVTRPVTLGLQALLTGDTIQVTAAPVTVVLAEYEIPEPEAGFVADVADEGTFEFTIFLKQA